MEERLLVLGASIDFVELVKKSKDRGYYTVVCDGIVGAPAKKFADKYYDVDVRKTDSIINICKKEGITGIIGSYSEVLIENITIIASCLKLKWYLNKDNIEIYREKNVQKKILAELGIDVPRGKKLQEGFGDEELDGFIFPVVIKPLNGYGSRGIFVVDSIEEIRMYFEKVTFRSPTKEIYVEEFCEGHEHNVHAWVCEGEVFILGIADRERNPRKDKSIQELTRIVYPAHDLNCIYSKVNDVLSRFVKYTGQTSGPISMQFFVKKNEVIVNEIAGRFLGYEYGIVNNYSGIDLNDLLLDYIYDDSRIREKIMAIKPSGRIYEAIYFLGKNGLTVKNQSQIELLKTNTFVDEVTMFYKNGEVIDVNNNIKAYFAIIYASSDDRRSLDEFTERVFNDLYVESVEGVNVLKKFYIEKY